MSQLVARHLAKRYGKKQAVQDISLAVESGQIVGLLGPNGAGKTTSFYMIVGMVRADLGEIELNGKSILNAPVFERARMGLSYLPQESSIFRNLTVADNIRAILQIQRRDNKKLSANEIEDRLELLLNDLNITHIRDQMGRVLSGGERRRTEIARALACYPAFILLDEPFAGVDPIAVIDIQKIILFLKQRNIGVLITDHNVRETLDICDHAYIVNQGKVLAHGDTQELVANETVRKVYLGEHFSM